MGAMPPLKETKKMKTLYLISQGTITECPLDQQWDGTESVLAYATTADDARVLASLYDDGMIQPDNVRVNGQTVVALTIYDN